MAVDDLTFSANGADDLQGFAAYADFYGAATDVSRADGAFRAKVSVTRVPRMVVYDRRISGVRHVRDARKLSRDGFDHITLHVLVAGDLIGGPLGDERHILPGSILVVDTARPYCTQMTDAHICSVQLAREHVRGALLDIDRLHGVVLPDASAGLFSDYLQSFMRRAGTLSAYAADRAAETAVELLGIAMSDGAPPLSKGADDALRRAQAEAFIYGRLADPSLDAEAVANGIGASRSALYRVFEADGGVARHIQRRRLDSLRRALLRTRDNRPVASLIRAHGFVSESHCSRAFAEAYGNPPKRYRDDMRRGRGPKASGDSATVIMRWASELY